MMLRRYTCRYCGRLFWFRRSVKRHLLKVTACGCAYILSLQEGLVCAEKNMKTWFGAQNRKGVM